MAVTVTYFSPHLGQETNAYDLSAAVGVGGSNLPNDVRLVQTLLKVFFYVHPNATMPAPAGHTDIAVDGKFGPQTHAHIRQFKALARRDGRNIPPDGKMDPYAGHPYRLTRQGAPYVQALLNNSAFRACERANRLADMRLQGPRPRDATFEVADELSAELNANIRRESAGYPGGPLRL